MTRFRRQPRSGRVLDRRRVTIILISALSALFVGVNYLSNNGDDYHYHESRNLDKTAALRSNTSDNQSSASKKEEDGMKRNNSLLNLHPASTENLPLCSATRISLTDKNSFDETKPTIFTDWSPAALENRGLDRIHSTSREETSNLCRMLEGKSAPLGRQFW